MDIKPLHHNLKIERDERISSSLFLTGNPAVGLNPSQPKNMHTRNIQALIKRAVTLNA